MTAVVVFIDASDDITIIVPDLEHRGWNTLNAIPAIKQVTKHLLLWGIRRDEPIMANNIPILYWAATSQHCSSRQ